MDFLKQILDLEIGTKQQSGIMSVYPLIGEDITDELASFKDIKFKGTVAYGTMIFGNNSEKPFIIPTGYSIITKQLAQDHGLPFATLINANTKHEIVNVACCIQQTQGGYINGDTLKENFSILPLYIRKEHFVKYFKESNDELLFEPLFFNRLWGIISSFQNKLVKNNVGNVVLFFNKFMDKLTQFNAEFEIVEGQRGAIIMLNDKIVGIEIVPTHEYWKTVWDSLIRDCYGSEVIRLTMNNLIEEFEKSRELELNLENCLTIEDIEKTIKIHENKEKDLLLKSLNEIISEKLVFVDKNKKLILRNSNDDLYYNLFKIKDKKIYGESYINKVGKMIYLSMLL